MKTAVKILILIVALTFVASAQTNSTMVRNQRYQAFGQNNTFIPNGLYRYVNVQVAYNIYQANPNDITLRVDFFDSITQTNVHFVGTLPASMIKVETSVVFIRIPDITQLTATEFYSDNLGDPSVEIRISRTEDFTMDNIQRYYRRLTLPDGPVYIDRTTYVGTQYSAEMSGAAFGVDLKPSPETSSYGSLYVENQRDHTVKTQ